MTDLLNLYEAAELAGVPPEQLKRWAWIGQGPKNSGSKLKPRYAEEDVREWLRVKYAFATNHLLDRML